MSNVYPFTLTSDYSSPQTTQLLSFSTQYMFLVGNNTQPVVSTFSPSHLPQTSHLYGKRSPSETLLLLSGYTQSLKNSLLVAQRTLVRCEIYESPSTPTGSTPPETGLVYFCGLCIVSSYNPQPLMSDADLRSCWRYASLWFTEGAATSTSLGPLDPDPCKISVSVLRRTLLRWAESRKHRFSSLTCTEQSGRALERSTESPWV